MPLAHPPKLRATRILLVSSGIRYLFIFFFYLFLISYCFISFYIIFIFPIYCVIVSLTLVAIVADV